MINLVALCVAFLVLLGLTHRSYRARLRELSPERDWIRLQGRLGQIRRSRLADLDLVLAPATHAFLDRVLTERAGSVRAEGVGEQLSVLAAGYEQSAAAWRTRSHLAILTGLLVTVVLISRSLHGGFDQVLQHVSRLYVFNAIAIGVALLCSVYSHRFQSLGHRVFRRATAALQELQPAGKPAVAAALDRLSGQLETWTREALDRYIGHLDAITSELAAIPSAVRESIGELIGKLPTTPDPEGAVRELQADVETLAERLEGGLTALAQPFLHWEEAVGRLDAAAEHLRNSVSAATNEDVGRAARAIIEWAERSQSAIARLDGAGMEAHHGAATPGLTASLAHADSPLRDVRLVDSVGSIEEHVEDILQHLRRATPSTNGHTPEPHAAEAGTTGTHLDAGPSVGGTKALRDYYARLRESQEEIAQGGTAAANAGSASSSRGEP